MRPTPETIAQSLCLVHGTCRAGIAALRGSEIEGKTSKGGVVSVVHQHGVEQEKPLSRGERETSC